MSKKKVTHATVDAAAVAKLEKAAKVPKAKAGDAPVAEKKLRAKKTDSAPVAEAVPAKALSPDKKVVKSAKAKVSASTNETTKSKTKGPEAAPLAAAPKGMGSPSTSNGMVAPATISQDDIARLAYSYAEARGFEGGSAEADWIRAEAELRSIRGL